MRKFEVLEVCRVFQEFFAVDRATIRFEKLDGAMSNTLSRLSVERGDAVGLIVLDRDIDRLIFVRQFRYPAVRHGMPWLIECAAGAIDEGETASDAAKRELEEELGYHATDLVHLGDFLSSPGGMSEQISMFFASVGAKDRIGKGGGLAQEDEDVERVEMTREEVSQALLTNGIRDAKTLVGLLQAKLRSLI